MAIVTGGLGQPESGAIVAGGLGTSQTDPNAMRATLAGSCTITANLTATGSTPEPEPTTGSGGRNRYLPSTKTLRPRIEFVTAARITAHLSGTSHLTARLDYEIDPDVLVAELAQLLLLDLV